MTRPVRIANCSGFYGDRLSAAREMVEGGPIDVLTGDYLAELTMLILWKSAQRDPAAGYARTFLRQLEEVLGTCADRGIKVVTNAGGLNPAGCADAVRSLAERLGLGGVRVAHVEGDDLLGRLDQLQALGHPLAHMDTGRPLADLGEKAITANAYLGGWGIAEALAGGADVVVCPRVTDASLVVGPAAWWHGWARDDWDRLAGAVVAGHVLECGAQATGGNYSFFTEVPGLEHPGFPLAEVAGDGSSVITKHPGTGGSVSVGTVTAQLLYEIGGPHYANPDVVARFDTIRLSPDGDDRVLVSGVRGEPAPPDLKVCINYLGGYRNTMTFVLTGLDVEAKAELARRSLFEALAGEDRFAHVDVRLVRSDVVDAPTNELAAASLHVTVRDPDPAKVGRAFSAAAIELALANYPGYLVSARPGGEQSYGVYWPALVPAALVDQVVVHHDGRRVPVPPTRNQPFLSPMGRSERPIGDKNVKTKRVPLGAVVGARSGDKGGNANVGLWARTEAAYQWLAGAITVDRFRELLPEAAGLDVLRHELPNLLALNFVVVGLLGEGVAASTRFDPQAKSLGEYVRSRLVDVPEALLAGQ
jgi:Acyclic terpene utilisation family protein AtuA